MDTAETAGCYRTVRERMTAFAAGLTRQEADTPVPALPAWTVRDTYAHLAGVCAEVLDGALTGRATDGDTARQVEQRKDRDLAELCAEWARTAPQIEELIAGPKGYRYNLMVQDVWNHEQDVLGALGRPQRRQDATTRLNAELVADMFARAWTKHGVSPAVRLKSPMVDRVIGVGEPVATLETSDFELIRTLIGRRTLAEMAEAGWTGDPAPVLDRLHFFDVPERGLGERE